MLDTITLAGVEYPVEQLKLKGWLELNHIQHKIEQAIERKHIDAISESIQTYVSIAFKVDNTMLSDLPWIEITTAYMAANQANKLDFKIPMMISMLKDFTGERWDYEGREFYTWANVFARNYHWTLFEIENLSIEYAVKLLQEILVSEQLQKEWEWSCSQNSVGMDQTTKKAKFVELPRPEWMREPQRFTGRGIKNLDAFVPPGLVIKLEERSDAKH